MGGWNVYIGSPLNSIDRQLCFGVIESKIYSQSNQL